MRICDLESTNLRAQLRRRRRQLQLRQHRRHPTRESLTPPFTRAPVLHGKRDIHSHRSVLRRAARTRSHTRRRRCAHCQRRGRRHLGCCLRGSLRHRAALHPLAAPPRTGGEAITAELRMHLQGVE